jgi:mevalonate pyrophosphate decarboxylase
MLPFRLTSKKFFIICFALGIAGGVIDLIIASKNGRPTSRTTHQTIQSDPAAYDARKAVVRESLDEMDATIRKRSEEQLRQKGNGEAQKK